MLPLLYFAERESAFLVLDFAGTLFLAAALAAVGNWTAAASFRYLPVGIATACQQGFFVITAALVGTFVFGDVMSLTHWSAIALILFGNTLAVLQRDSSEVRLSPSSVIGALCCMSFGIFLGIAFSLVAKLSRAIDPLAIAYFWEFSIGILCASMVLVRGLAFKPPQSPKLNRKALFGIFLCASPTAIGTGCYAVAVTMGPIGVVTSILSTLVIASAVISYFLYQERLSSRQVLAIGLVLCAIVAIRLSESA